MSLFYDNPSENKNIRYEEEDNDSFKEREKKTEIETFLRDVCAHAEVTQSTQEEALRYYKKIYKILKVDQIRLNQTEKRIIMAYSLYETLARLKIPRTANEIAYFTECTTTSLFKIESRLKLSSTFSDPADFVSRFGSYLNLSYQDIRIIRRMTKNMYWMGDAKPNSIVAIAIQLYCEKNNIRISLKEICEKCDISLANMYALLRRIKIQHADKIKSLLCMI